MDISGVSGTSGYDAASSTASAISDKQLFGAEVVTATLGKLNEKGFGSSNSDYDFQKDVLEAAYVGKNVNVSA